jgi:glycosyltransferase involved in cell wall biosynthesis
VISVVHIITDLDRGGAETMLIRLLEAADRKRFHHSVISLTTGGALAPAISRLGIDVTGLGMRPGRISLRSLWRLVSILQNVNPDVLQTWLYHADLAGLIAGSLAGVRAIAWNIRCVELDARDHPRLLSLVLRALVFASRWPAVVISNSNEGRLAHERLGYSPRRWVTIPNGFETDVFRPDCSARREVRREFGIGDGGLLVGILARYHPMKDLATFIRAAALISRERSDVHFVAAGRGVSDNPNLLRLVSELRIERRIQLLPERADAPRFLAALDLAVSSSYSEAFPNVVGEAMACGVPCVVTDVGESRRIVADTGRVVPSRNPQRLAEAMRELLALDADSRQILGREARQRIATEFSIDRVAAQYERLYEELAGGRVIQLACDE